jgi:hypothetical protein
MNRSVEDGANLTAVMTRQRAFATVPFLEAHA